nr:toxin glutamine deamidase domain-containing protein [Streptomyces lavendulae]
MNNTGQTGYRVNCTHNVVTVDRRLDGIEVSAAPRANPGDVPYEELGVKPSAKKVVQSYDDIIRDLEARGEGSRSVVAISRHGRPGHVFNAVNTPHGVVFLDGQTGTLARLETKSIEELFHVPYR